MAGTALKRLMAEYKREFETAPCLPSGAGRGLRRCAVGTGSCDRPGPPATSGWERPAWRWSGDAGPAVTEGPLPQPRGRPRVGEGRLAGLLGSPGSDLGVVGSAL